jgi:hypothetical protein
MRSGPTAPRIVIVRSRFERQLRHRDRAVADPAEGLTALPSPWAANGSSYGFKVKGTKLTLSGGDLQKPITADPGGRTDSAARQHSPIPPDPDTQTQ